MTLGHKTLVILFWNGGSILLERIGPLRACVVLSYYNIGALECSVKI